MIGATILLVGHQAAGTRGAALQAGARTLLVHGRDVPIHARVVVLDGLSAHADSDELRAWLASLERAPRQVFVTHGEPRQSNGTVGTMAVSARGAGVANDSPDRIARSRHRLRGDDALARDHAADR